MQQWCTAIVCCESGCLLEMSVSVSSKEKALFACSLWNANSLLKAFLSCSFIAMSALILFASHFLQVRVFGVWKPMLKLSQKFFFFFCDLGLMPVGVACMFNNCSPFRSIFTPFPDVFLCHLAGCMYVLFTPFSDFILCHLTECLYVLFTPFPDVIQPFYRWISSLRRSIHYSKYSCHNQSVVIHSVYESKHVQLPLDNRLHYVLFKLQSPSFVIFCCHRMFNMRQYHFISHARSLCMSCLFIVHESPAYSRMLATYACRTILITIKVSKMIRLPRYSNCSTFCICVLNKCCVLHIQREHSVYAERTHKIYAYKSIG